MSLVRSSRDRTKPYRHIRAVKDRAPPIKPLAFSIPFGRFAGVASRVGDVKVATLGGWCPWFVRTTRPRFICTKGTITPGYWLESCDSEPGHRFRGEFSVDPRNPRTYKALARRCLCWDKVSDCALHCSDFRVLCRSLPSIFERYGSVTGRHRRWIVVTRGASSSKRRHAHVGQAAFLFLSAVVAAGVVGFSAASASSSPSTRRTKIRAVAAAFGHLVGPKVRRGPRSIRAGHRRRPRESDGIRRVGPTERLRLLSS